MPVKTVERFFNNVFLILAFILVVGTPLVFTPLTRSVFEVNKMLLLRGTLLIAYFFWFLRTVLFENLPNNDKNCIRILGYNWKKTGLEIPMLLWFIVNIISTIWSQNLRVSIFGAYDRWEGIITLIGYMMLIFMFAKLITTKKQLFWTLGGILGSTFFSAWYGIFQSVGFDFMQWSKDPTFRVFACINNPVHFCAYVAMVVPIGVSLLLYLTKKEEQHNTSNQKSLSKFLLPTVAIIGLAYLYNIAFDSISLSFIQMILLVLIGLILCITTKTTIPSKENALHWSIYFSLLSVLIFSNLLNFDRFQWLGYTVIMISMITLSPFPNLWAMLKRLIFISIGVIYYTQILSFSRATWIGFLLTMPFLYLYITQLLKTSSQRAFFKDILTTFFASILLTLIIVFKVTGIIGSLPITIFVLILTGIVLFIPTLNLMKEKYTSVSFILPYIVVSLFLFWTLFMADFSQISQFEFIVKLAALIGLFYLSARESRTLAHFIARISILFIFLFVQFSGKSILNIIIYCSMCGIFYLNGIKPTSLSREDKFWTFLSLISFGLVMCIPTFPLLQSSIMSLFNIQNVIISALNILTLGLFILTTIIVLLHKKLEKKHLFIGGVLIAVVISIAITMHSSYSINTPSSKEKGLIALENLEGRTEEYDKELHQSARISMWKSAIPWVLDHPLFGTGPDTIKYMYPVYRRPEYGRLEGGHNFTPDRLHNEYVNTAATRGLIGFAVYYFGIILIWLYIALKSVFQYRHSKLSLITLSLIISGLIYLGQVVFNFGVVATLVLFYISLGLSLGMANQSTFFEESTTND